MEGSAVGENKSESNAFAVALDVILVLGGQSWEGRVYIKRVIDATCDRVRSGFLSKMPGGVMIFDVDAGDVVLVGVVWSVVVVVCVVVVVVWSTVVVFVVVAVVVVWSLLLYDPVLLLYCEKILGDCSCS